VGINQAIGTDKVPIEVATAVRNNGGGHWNHSFFWSVLAGPTDSNGPSAELKAGIDSAFGSLDEMKTKFNQVGQQGAHEQEQARRCCFQILIF
jgi:Fe-Mn family superoxide dismutase